VIEKRKKKMVGPSITTRRHWRQRQWSRRCTPLFTSLLLLLGCALLFTWNNNYSVVVSAGSVDSSQPDSSSKSGVIALTAKNFDSSLRNGNGKRDRVNSSVIASSIYTKNMQLDRQFPHISYLILTFFLFVKQCG
jgi:hypothetical protein